MQHLSFSGKKVLVRVDFNVPLDEKKHITDDTRMVKAIPTIKAILAGGGAAILMSHLGRPQKKLLDDGSVDKDKFSLRPLVDHLSDLSGASVHFVEDCIGPKAEQAVQALQQGEILLLENTRFHAGEEEGDRAFARQLASLGDIFINDAFGTAHRAHASTTVVARYFESNDRAFGLLMQQELANANKVLHDAERPLIAILGGAKVSDKIGLLNKLIELADEIIIGGAMAFTFIKAQGGHTGKSLVEEDKLEMARTIMAKAEQQKTPVHLPSDAIAADEFATDARTMVVPISEIPDGWMGLDIGEESRIQFAERIRHAMTILWNGPMGVFEMEPFAGGTLAIARAVASRSKEGAYSLIGGGDSVAAINQSGVADDVSFISTGGGAMLEFLEGKELPGVAAIRRNSSD